MINLKQSQVAFSENPHGYWLGEKRISGITTLIHEVLKLGVYSDASDYVKEYLIPKAGEYGTAVHKAIEFFDVTGIKQTKTTGEYGSYDVSCELDNYIKHKTGFTALSNEYTVSDDERYASNIDNIWIKESTNGIWLIDTKTNNTQYYPGGVDALKEYLSWQLSIYAYLFERQNPELKVEGLMCNWLRHDKDELWIIQRKDDGQVAKLLSATYEIDQDGRIGNYHLDGAEELIGKPTIQQPLQIIGADVVNLIYQVQKQYEESEAILKELKAKLRSAMESNSVKSWDSGQFKATIAADSTTKSFDSTGFKKDYPDLYSQYTVEKKRAGGFTIKLKNEEK